MQLAQQAFGSVATAAKFALCIAFSEEEGREGLGREGGACEGQKWLIMHKRFVVAREEKVR